MKTMGFTLIEVIVAIFLAAIFLPAIGLVLSLATQTASQGEKLSKAYAMAQEGMEAIMYLKNVGDANWDWTTTPTNTGASQYYQPTQTGGVWSLGAIGSAALVPNPFARKVEINQVRRCGAGADICSDIAAPVDPYTRKIIVTVTFTEKGQPTSAVLTAYVSKH